MKKLSYLDSPYISYSNSAEEFIAYTKSKTLSEEEYLASFLGVLHNIMINDGAAEILIMGYAPLLLHMSELCKKYDLPELADWLNGIRLHYEQVKPEFDILIEKQDREAIYGSWKSTWREYEKDYFNIVQKT